MPDYEDNSEDITSVQCIPVIHGVIVPATTQVFTPPFPCRVMIQKGANCANQVITLSYLPNNSSVTQIPPGPLTPVFDSNLNQWVATADIAINAMPNGGTLTISAENPAIHNSKVASTPIIVFP